MIVSFCPAVLMPTSERKPAFADQRPAALAGADEIDHVNARLGQLRELERPAHAAEGRFRVGLRLARCWPPGRRD